MSSESNHAHMFESLLHGALTSATEKKLIDLLTSPQDGGKPSPLQIVGENAMLFALTPEGSKIAGRLLTGGALF